MSSVNIRIKGLALCLKDDENGLWRMFFPKAKDHIFKVIISKTTTDSTTGEYSTEETEYVMPTATWIDVTPNDAISVTTADVIDEKTPNIVALHDEAITLTDDKSRYAGFLNLRNCVLESQPDPFMAQNIDVWDSREQPNPTKENPSTKVWMKRETNIHNNFLSQLSLAENSSIDILMQNNFAIEMNARLIVQHEAGADYTIIFSNDCDGIHCETISDFKYFYNIIDETQLTTKRQFEFVEITPAGGQGTNGVECGGSGMQPSEMVYLPFSHEFPGTLFNLFS